MNLAKLTSTSNNTISSREIAELSGKQHKHVLEAIRNMEPAWEKVRGSKFRLTQYETTLPTGGIRKTPSTSSQKPNVYIFQQSLTTRLVQSSCCAGNNSNISSQTLPISLLTWLRRNNS